MPLASESFTKRSACTSHVSGRASFIAIQLAMQAVFARWATGAGTSGTLTRFHALEPVEVVLFAPRQRDFDPCGIEELVVARVEGTQPAARNRRVLRGHAPARHEDPTIISDEFEAVRKLVGNDRPYAMRIGEFHVICAMDVPDFVFWKFRPAFDPARTAELDVERPMQNIVVMRAPPA